MPARCGGGRVARKMSAAVAQDPFPLSPLGEVQRIIEELPEADRKRLKNWAVPAIVRAHARLFEEPPSQALIQEVVREVAKAYFSVRSLVKAASQPMHVASGEAVVMGEWRRAEAFLEDPDASETFGFIFQAHRLQKNWLEEIRRVAPEVTVVAARLTEAAAAGQGLFVVKPDPTAEQAQMKAAVEALLDLIATHEIEGTNRALLILEAVAAAARRRDPSLRTRARELTRLAQQEAESGAATLLGLKLEPIYGDLGRRRGSPAEIEAREARRRIWHDVGWWAAWWLAQRLRTERDVEVLADAASALADIGREAVDPVVRELRRAWPDGPAEQVEALLDALRWLPADDAASIEVVDSVLAQWLRHDDADLRERALAATRALPAEQACRLLRAALEAETDAGLRDLINDEIATREESAPADE